ncbi:glycerophosphodiester phosphodiesterase family protein [Homoserinibacter sp. GY 40078]|uniref:glycerophosphodiester phosphodiesterase n=1 Tax=Homoserinibacter sp. GY 40078 TaxID=2603275 RepID=UPI0011CC08FE|nr:glycerophosphodiester phosphodiesterase family protein [Homoserinibacter sp. GY 40078]TXK18805.1 glycerophosphodiester phosphodiesterase [Homoserinibacter sp. GY 40078]
MTRPLVIAHRGSHSELPEQTRAAYLRALDEGADGVECDVRMTADGEVVCIHDASVDRTSDGSGAVHELTLAELRTLDFRAGADVPRETQLLTLGDLIELLTAAGRELVLAIELKHPNPVGTALEEAVLRVLGEYRWDPQTARLGSLTVSLMSFNPDSVAALSPVVPAQHLMLLTADIRVEDITAELPPDLDPAGSADLAAQLDAALQAGRELLDAGAVGWVGPDLEFVRAHPERIAAWGDAGLRMRVWTVDDEHGVRDCLAAGVDEITTDVPALVRAHLDAAEGAAPQKRNGTT